MIISIWEDLNIYHIYKQSRTISLTHSSSSVTRSDGMEHLYRIIDLKRQETKKKKEKNLKLLSPQYHRGLAG